MRDQTFEVKVQLYISNQRFIPDFSQPSEGAVQVIECSVFLKLLLKTPPSPSFSPTRQLKFQTGFIPLPVLPFLYYQRFPFRRQIWGEPLIALTALNSPLADKGIDQPLTATMIIPSPSSWLGDRCTQLLSKWSSNQVHRVVSVQPLSCTDLHTAKQKEVLCTFSKTMISREKETLVQHLTQERRKCKQHKE